MNYRTLESNKIGGFYIDLILCKSRYEILFHDSFGDPDESQDLGICGKTARKEYAKFCETQRSLPANRAVDYGPDWEAQAAYDAAHGTVNGHDPAILEYRELVGE
ncbi:MAG: hypothetical protein Tp138OMZ00d2C19078261_7 [Prokaryotic dsDNA virus sp.]|jgi:hypothetical protein|nr:MAG: hypothetical protein Tp138OMZ00d2C19078261_7 [Prokaryotic dsDNA virus sp.]|tara:strand:- start:12635 stop:12949 length:315 start_codon:yes stop_codon:yes gene_type:complete